MKMPALPLVLIVFPLAGCATSSPKASKASEAATAAGNRAEPPTFGEPSPGSILVSARGHSFSEPGDYYLTSKSLAAFMREKIKALCDSDSGQIRVHRVEAEKKYVITVKFGDLRTGKDVTLRHGDIIMITCLYF